MILGGPLKLIYKHVMRDGSLNKKIILLYSKGMSFNKIFTYKECYHELLDVCEASLNTGEKLCAYAS